MQKKNASLGSDNACQIVLYDESETIEMFGRDYLDDYGVCVPNELISRYQKTLKEFDLIQSELRKIQINQELKY